MKKAKQRKWIMSSGLSLLLMAIGAVCLAESVYASIGGGHQSLPAENDLVQLRAGSHIMGFQPDKVYLVNAAGFLSVDFLGSHAVAPIVTAGERQRREDTVLKQGGGDTLASLQRVEYPELWNGISLRYDAVPDGIAESSYFVQPGADVANIRFHYNGDTELQKDGSLKINIATQQGYISESRPVAWQVINGIKEPVQVAYEIQGQTIGFRTGAYNKDHELIIDPTYQWHSFFGSADYDSGEAIAVDGSGNVYMTGFSRATWNGPDSGSGHVSPINAYSGGDDIVVIKLNSSGDYQWHTFYGSATTDGAYGIAIDSLGNVYVTGFSAATWGSPTGGNTYQGGSDIVVIKLNSSGAYQWHTFHGSDWYEKGRGIAIDSDDNVYVTSSSYAWNGPTGQLPLNDLGDNNYNIVVIKLNSSGVYQWHTFYGYSDNLDDDYDIAVDSSNNVYVTGLSQATWNGPDSGSGAVPPIHAHSGGGNSEIVIFKLNSNGIYQWHTFYGTVSFDEGHGIAIDTSNNVYVTGRSDVAWDGPLGETPLNSSGGSVVIKLDSDGAYQWHTFHGSTSNARSNGIATDASNNVYVTGQSETWDGPAGEAPLNVYNDGSDIMVIKLNSSGAYQWHTFYGSTLEDEGQSIAIDGSKNIYVTGYSQATWNGPGAAAPLNAYGGGNADIVVFKLNGKSSLTIKTKGLGTVTSTPAGINCGVDCTENYDDGTDVILTALSAEPDLNFSRWIIDCTGTDTTATVMINGDKTCTAIFSSFPWPMFLPAIIHKETL
ncbi:MAG: SBBP repeat-containing protein [Desulfocapsaceae bacterium]|nr:SBBP repeat-containing protein [Desulfocapsaceae bacterium]